MVGTLKPTELMTELHLDPTNHVYHGPSSRRALLTGLVRQRPCLWKASEAPDSLPTPPRAITKAGQSSVWKKKSGNSLPIQGKDKQLPKFTDEKEQQMGRALGGGSQE